MRKLRPIPQNFEHMDINQELPYNAIDTFNTFNATLLIDGFEIASEINTRDFAVTYVVYTQTQLMCLLTRSWVVDKDTHRSQAFHANCLVFAAGPVYIAVPRQIRLQSIRTCSHMCTNAHPSSPSTSNYMYMYMLGGINVDHKCKQFSATSWENYLANNIACCCGCE